MRQLWRETTVALALVALMSSPAHAQPAPYCVPGAAPSFTPALLDFNDQIGGIMGDPLECLHADPQSGNSVQQTTTGLAVLQVASNLPGFVSGDEHWQLTPDGSVFYWMEPPAAPQPAPAMGEQPAIVDAVVADAAARVGVDSSQVQVMRWERVQWPDSSLGCPQPGMAYAQVISPGWRIIVQANGQTLEYHTDESSRFVSCAAANPRVPPIDGA